MSPWTYYTLYAFAHLFLAGLGASWLAGRLGLGRLPSWAAGALWMASGPLLSVVDAWNQLAGAAWMPWAIGSGLDALRGRWRGALAWGGASALQVLGGSPETGVLGWAGVGVLAIAHLRRSHWQRARLVRAAAGAGAAAVLTLGLSAAQWLPALDAAARAGRTHLPREARTHWSVHPLHLAQSFLPVPLHRVALTSRTRDELFGAPDPFLPSIYLGAASVALAAAALRRPSRATWGLLALGLLATATALGRHGPVYDALVALAPPLQAFRYPAKALLLASLAWSVAAAQGVGALTDARPRRGPALAGGAAALACLGVVLVILGGGGRVARVLADPGDELASLAARIAVGALLAGAGAALALRAWPHRAAAMTALALADLAVAHHDLNPTAPVALYTHVPDAVAAARDPGGGRLYVYDYLEPGAGQRLLGRPIPYLLERAPVGWDVRAAQALALREALFPPIASVWGAEGSYERDVPGLEPAPLARLKDAFRAGSLDARRRLLGMAAVSRIAALHASAGGGREPLGRYPGYFVDPVLVFEAPPGVPRAYRVGGARVATDDTHALATVLAPDFEPAREVVLTGGAGAGTAPGSAGSARVVERRTDRVRLETDGAAAGWVVLVDAWDPGWRAFVDGRPARLERANVAFRAVAVPAGRHDVLMTFRPPMLAPGLWISAVTTLGLATGWRITRERPGTTEGTAT
jgi:hypothetical protein